MKNIAFLYLIAVLSFFSACQKGDDLPERAYGKMSIYSTLSGSVTPILVQCNGVTRDTLSMQRQEVYDIVMEAGKFEYKLVKQEDHSVLFEDSLYIEAGKTTNAPPFIYDGITILFDDMTVKPEKDSALVRFINLMPALPDMVEIKVYVNDEFTGAKQYVKTLQGIGKDQFSSFLQLSDPKSILPGEQPYYSIDLYDQSTGELKASDRRLFFTTEFSMMPFIPNAVLSISFTPPKRGSNPIFTSVFQHIAE